jgi:hypothetical protein
MADIIRFKPSGMRPLLREAQQKRQLVRVWRGNLESGSFCGYIGAIGQEFFLMWVLGDNLAFDGVYALRQRDVTEIETPDKHHRFLEQAIALKRLQPQFPADFALDDVKGVVESAARFAPVLSVCVDGEDEAEVCYIGRLLGFEDDGFTLQEVTPDAEWLREPSFFVWDEVSTISIADPYAEVLAEIAGAPPALEHGDPDVGRAH